jgi:hypothetical protein
MRLGVLIQSVWPANKLLEEQTCDRRANYKPGNGNCYWKWVREERPKQKGQTSVYHSEADVDADDQA